MNAARVLVVQLVAAVWLWCGPLAAHPESRAYCSVRTVLSGFDAEFDVALHPPLTPADVVRAMLASVEATTPAGACSVEAAPPRLKQSPLEQRVGLTLHFRCPPGAVSFANRWGMERDPRSESLCAIDGAPWVFRRDAPSVDLGTPPRPWTTLREYFRRAAALVLGRWAAPALVLVLFAAAALRRGERRRWVAPLVVLAGLVLGHSAGFGLGLRGVLAIDPRVATALTALGAIALGLENWFVERPRWRALNAGLFGSIHGLGAATVFGRSAPPESGTSWALAGFWLGLELAQLALALLLAGALVPLAARPGYARRVLRPATALAAVMALAGVVLALRAVSAPG